MKNKYIIIPIYVICFLVAFLFVSSTSSSLIRQSSLDEQVEQTAWEFFNRDGGGAYEGISISGSNANFYLSDFGYRAFEGNPLMMRAYISTFFRRVNQDFADFVFRDYGRVNPRTWNLRLYYRNRLLKKWTVSGGLR